MTKTSHWSESQVELMWIACVALLLLHTAVLSLAVWNLVQMCKVNIRQKLIVLLYASCIGKELMGAIWALCFTIEPTDEINSVTFWTSITCLTFDFAVNSIVITSNLVLANAIKMLNGKISPQRNDKLNRILLFFGVCFVIFETVVVALAPWCVYSLPAALITWVVFQTFSLVELNRQLGTLN